MNRFKPRYRGHLGSVAAAMLALVAFAGVSAPEPAQPAGVPTHRGLDDVAGNPANRTPEKDTERLEPSLLLLEDSPPVPRDDTRTNAALAGADIRATLKTTMGDIVVRLFSKEAPKTVANFVGLASGEKEYTDPKTGKKSKAPFYDGTIFHRVIPNFMVQAGDRLGTGTGDPGYRFADEFQSGRKFDKVGLLAMANAGPGTNGSQFFITTSLPAYLNGKHTIFGEVISGYEVVERISSVPRNRMDRPNTEVVVTRIDISLGSTVVASNVSEPTTAAFVGPVDVVAPPTPPRVQSEVSGAGQVSQQRLATVEVMSALVSVGKADGSKWDGFGKVNPRAVQGLVQAVLSKSPYTAVASMVAGAGMEASSKPDPAGYAEFLDGDQGLRRLDLPKIQDTFTPMWGVGWQGVHVSKNSRLRIVLWDVDLRLNDPIGTVEVTGQQLLDAGLEGKVVQISVADQSNNQLLYVGISVRFQQ